MINKKHKKAFSMVTAIFVIFIMSSVTMLIMNVTGKTIKATTNQYQKEQAQLLARNYTELAILYVIHYDRTIEPNCLKTITDHFGETGANGYDIRVNIQYIANTALIPTADCPTNITPAWSVTSPTGFDATVSLVINTFITYKDFDDPSNRDITFHRRTLQKL